MYRARPFLKLAPALCLCAPLAAWRNITTADNDARPSYTREEVNIKRTACFGAAVCNAKWRWVG